MRRTAGEVIRDLEIRIAHLEKEAGVFDRLFKSTTPVKPVKVTVATEEKLIEQQLKATKGVLSASVDLSDPYRLKASVNFQGADLHLTGLCTQDHQGVYSENVRPYATLRSKNVLGNTYIFNAPGSTDYGTSLVFSTEGGEINFADSELHHENLSNLLSRSNEMADKEQKHRERAEARAHNERVRQEREERKRERRVRYEANR